MPKGDVVRFRRLIAAAWKGLVSGPSRRGALGAQMLAAVEAVTSMSPWQLVLFNA